MPLKRLVLISIVLFCLTSVYRTLMYSKDMSGLSDDINALYKKVSSKYPNSIIIPANSLASNIYLTPQHGLLLGDYASSHKESDELAHLYPNTYFFNTEMTEPSERDDGYGIRDFYGNRSFADDFLSSGVPVIFIRLGRAFPDYGLNVHLIEKSRYVNAYLLLGSTEKEANAFFLQAMALCAQGKYPEAFLSAFKSRSLNFQPENKINYLISLLYFKLDQNKK